MRERQTVIVIGDDPIDENAFAERTLSENQPLAIHKFGAEKVAQYFPLARALIISEPPGKFENLGRYVATLLPGARDHGVLIVILVTSEADRRQVRGLSKELEAKIFLKADSARAAEYIARTEVGPELEHPDAKIDCAGITLSETDSILLKRAFYDCKRLYVEPLTGGKNSRFVFRVHAWMTGSEAGVRPLPFIAKIGDPGKIERERDNYNNYAELFVSFNLRPNLIDRRFVKGPKSAVLVGNFVGDAAPLRKALRMQIAGTALFSLFEKTLMGFRVQPFAGGSKEPGLGPFVQKSILAERIPKNIVRIASTFGFQSDPRRLEESICSRAKGIHTWIGPIHGDLHADNVMIRQGDAILIDFGKVRSKGPLSADPATMEVSLVFGTDEEDDADNVKEWMHLVDEIYLPGCFARALKPASEPSEFSWLRQAVRDLRHIFFGCDTAEDETAIVLATFLMRFARLEPQEFESSKLSKLAVQRHAYALRAAERIIAGLS